jgi:hypothetical protein
MKILLFFLATTLFAESITLQNQTSHPSRKTKLYIQFAATAREVQEQNELLIRGIRPSMQSLAAQPKLTVSLPHKAQYFRLLVCPEGKPNPELLTNWVDAVPNKTYLLKDEHLTPAVLMTGMGC